MDKHDSASYRHPSSSSGDTLAAAYLVCGSSDGLREAKERQGQVHEAVLERFQLLVSLDNLDELQAHQTNHCGRGSGDGRNDLASYQLALYWTVKRTSMKRENKEFCQGIQTYQITNVHVTAQN